MRPHPQPHHHPQPYEHGPVPPHCPPPMLPFAPDCDDQLPVFSRVGRGLTGDSITAETYEQDGHIFIRVIKIDNNTGEQETLIDRCIDGGRLEYMYNLNPFSDPSTFTITFRYDHPDPELGWIWTTPAIPYMWQVDPETGEPTATGLVGSGVGSLFIKKVGESWTGLDIPTSHTEAEAESRQEKLLYPAGWDRYQFNAPAPGDPWTVNLTYGVGGDIDAPNLDDLCKVLGVTPADIESIVENRDVPDLVTDTFGTKANNEPKNAKEYIDDLVSGLETSLKNHFHADLGSDADELAGDDSSTSNGWDYTKKYDAAPHATVHCQTVRDYIDTITADLKNGIDAAATAAGNAQTAANNAQTAADKANTTLGDLLAKIYPGTATIGSDGHISWPAAVSGSKIPMADLNIWAGIATPTNEYANAIRSRDLHDDDLKAV